ncbi:3-keto-disaccharide hydrolase [Salmonirosea aquatica]
MKYIGILALSFLFVGCAKDAAISQKKEKGWVPIFNGKNFDGWKVTTDSPGTFTIEDGTIKVAGDRAHLFYEGPVGNHDFKNFAFKADIKTMPGANSGMFIHTAYQPDGWPAKGYEIQVNQSHTDWRKTGSVYSFQDVKEVYAKDGEWYTEEIEVQGKHVTVKVNGKVINDYTEPAEPKDAQKRLSHGTVALQGHDPKSVIYYKNVMVKVLPE